MKFQHIVMSGDQLMIIDGQPTHQVIVNQPHITYGQNPSAGIVNISQHQPQTVFFMDNSGNASAELAQVETVELQPILLNHRLGSQISLVQRPAKTSLTNQPLSLMQQVQQLNSPKIIRSPAVNQISSSQAQPVQIANQEYQTSHLIRAIQEKQQDSIGDQPSVTIERTGHLSRQQMNHGQQIQKTVDATLCPVSQQKVSSLQYYERQVTDQAAESDKQELMSLSDGKVLTVAEYQEMLLKQQQQKLNMMSELSVKARTPSANTPRPRSKPTNTSRSRQKSLQKPISTNEEGEEARFLNQTNSTRQMTELDKQETVSVGDGKVMTVSDYQEMLLKQQQQKLNMMPDISVKPARPQNVTTPKSRGKPVNTVSRARPKLVQKPMNTEVEGEDASRFLSQPNTTQRFAENTQTPQRRASVPTQSPSSLHNRSVPHAQYPSQGISRSQPTPAANPQMSNVLQQQQRQNNHNYLIQPPKKNLNKSTSQMSLPSCVPFNQIKQIIENTPVCEEYSDSIRMLIMLSNGEQRLITFTLPNQACTIQEILEQVGVPLQPDTPVEVSEANSNEINYMVTVGFVPGASQSEEPIESVDSSCQTTPPVESRSDVSSPMLQSPFKESSPEPVKESEQPKYIEGKMAVCGYCGILSDDFNKCTRCKTKLPENVKSIPATSSIRKNEDKVQMTHKKPEQIGSPIANGKEQNAIKKKITPKNKHNDETVVLTLSSDEEEEPNDKLAGPIDENILQKLGSAITLSPIIKKEPSMSDMQKIGTSEGEKCKVYPENMKSLLLHCRTVRIGSYRTIPKENVSIEYGSVTIKVANIVNLKEIITVTIDRNDIVKVLICFHKQLPVLFYYLRPNMGASIREILGMSENSVNYYDPLSDNESHRRITLLPENISEDSKILLTEIYRPSTTSNILDELTVKEANDILMKTCPKELTLANLQPSGFNSDVKLLFTYPPEGRGRLSINTEDYMCLGSDQFLNDVIIDFYLKFLVHNLTPEEQERIHVFSTFFYKRLTTKPVKASRKIQPAELDPNLSPAEKRHARVKTWTKNIDLFKKDYVIVPINENCHWFLAIICFPGIDGCQTMDGNPIKIDITPKKKLPTKKATIGNVTITPMKKEEFPCEDLESDKDEAEGDESELESDDSEETQTVTSHANRPPIKQPCILIFDSLAGTGRSRVVATLRDYLTCEYKTKNNKEKVFNKDVIKGACPKVPQQTNFTDCGLYLLQYVEHFFMEPIKDYYIPINSLKNWFDEITVTRKREDISILIRTLMSEYDKDTRLLPDITFPTKNGIVVDQFADDEEEMDEDMSDNDEFNSPPIGSETEIDHSMSAQEEDSVKLENSPIKPSCESVSDNNDVLEQTVSNIELLKPDISELTVPKQQSSRDALSYLKAKRIIRHKNLDSPSKRMKNSE